MSNQRKIRSPQSPSFPRVVTSPRIQAVIDEDARFWEANPDVWERTRPYVPGEITDEHGVEPPPAWSRALHPLSSRPGVARRARWATASAGGCRCATAAARRSAYSRDADCRKSGIPTR